MSISHALKLNIKTLLLYGTFASLHCETFITEQKLYVYGQEKW